MVQANKHQDFPSQDFALFADRQAGEVLGWVASGELKVRVGGECTLAEAAEAHRQLEGRLSTGKLLLIPYESDLAGCDSSGH